MKIKPQRKNLTWILIPWQCFSLRDVAIISSRSQPGRGTQGAKVNVEGSGFHASRLEASAPEAWCGHSWELAGPRLVHRH